MEESPHHTNLDVCTKPNGELMTIQEILSPNNGIFIDQLFGSPILYITLCGIPMNKFSGLFNEKLRAEGTTIDQLASSKSIDKRVEAAIKHKFGVFGRDEYRVRKKEWSEAHKKQNVALRTTYIAMLRNPATDLVNPKTGCCLKTMEEGMSDGELEHEFPEIEFPEDEFPEDELSEDELSEYKDTTPLGTPHSLKRKRLGEDTEAVLPGVQAQKNHAKRSSGDPQTRFENFTDAEQNASYSKSMDLDPFGPQKMTATDHTDDVFSYSTFPVDFSAGEPGVEQATLDPALFGAGFDGAGELADEEIGDFGSLS